MGVMLLGRGQPGSPGSDGASPYQELHPNLRRACHGQASARRMGLFRLKKIALEQRTEHGAAVYPYVVGFTCAEQRQKSKREKK
jgi:hypothetical protein